MIDSNGDIAQVRSISSAGARRRSLLAQWVKKTAGVNRQALAVWGVVIILFPASRLFSKSFPSWQLFGSTIDLGLFLVIAAWGQGLVILTGGIDLSVAAGITVGAYFTGYFASSNVPLYVAMVLGVLISGLIGLVNGVLVALFKYPPFIVTLATAGIASALLLGFSGGTPGVSAPNALAVVFKPASKMLGVPVALTILAAAIVVGYIIQTRSTFGRRVYGIGNSHAAARTAGIKVQANLVWVYIAAAISYGITGVLLLGYSAGSNLNIGNPLLLPSIAAVVVGGSSISGGKGTFLGTVGAALLITIFGTDIGAAGFSQGVQNIFYGAVILAALVVIRFTSRDGDL